MESLGTILTFVTLLQSLIWIGIASGLCLAGFLIQYAVRSFAIALDELLDRLLKY